MSHPAGIYTIHMPIRSQVVYSIIWLSNLISEITFVKENFYLLQWENIVKNLFLTFSFHFVSTMENNRKSIPPKGRSSVPISKLTKCCDAYEIHQKQQGADETHQKWPGIRKQRQGAGAHPKPSAGKTRYFKQFMSLSYSQNQNI